MKNCKHSRDCNLSHIILKICHTQEPWNCQQKWLPFVCHVSYNIFNEYHIQDPYELNMKYKPLNPNKQN